MNLNATLIGQLIAFALFVWFCMKFVWPPIINAIETRQSQIANALASAEAAKKEQADTKNLVEQELLSAKVQAQEILDAANKRRNEVLDEVKAEAEELKAKIIAQGYAEVEAERKRVQEGKIRILHQCLHLPAAFAQYTLIINIQRRPVAIYQLCRTCPAPEPVWPGVIIKLKRHPVLSFPEDVLIIEGLGEKVKYFPIISAKFRKLFVKIPFFMIKSICRKINC